MFKSIYYLIILTALISCSNKSVKKKQIRDVLNSTVNFSSLKAVLPNDSVVPINKVLKTYKYFYIVYLQDGCQPCYPKFIEWHKRLADMPIPDNFSVLFVIQGRSHESFMRQVRKIEDIDNRYCILMDLNYEFIDANSKIPHWIIDASMLIDSDNKIKIVGVPWLNNDMEELFLKTINMGM